MNGLLGGRYRLGQRVGVGGMATIYRARDIALARDVAVKVIHAHLADDAEIQERFRHEARHAAALAHPHIVAVFDQGVDGLPYMVMELVDGPSLRQVLHERGRLSPPEALAVVLPVCAALARAHAAGVVHRDIKPENVLIAPDGSPKVADFGIAHAVNATRHTARGTLIGSVHYLAPELIHGYAATPATDQYAVGVLMFELLTGRKPLPADTPMAVVTRHAREPIPPPGRFAPDVPAALDRAICRATALNPADRFPEVRRLAAALRAAVPGAEPVDVWGDRTLVIPAVAQETMSVASANGLGRRQVRPTRPRPRLRAVAALLLALVFLAGLPSALYTLWDRAVAPVRPVPFVEGMSREQARSTLGVLGLAMVEGPPEPSLEDPEGTVLSQRPPPGTRLRRGEAVTVVLSSGPRIVPMPRVLTLSEEEARAVLARHAFKVARDESFSADAPTGEVIAQLPDAGTPVREGSEVRIHVSKGKEQVQVPNLERATRQEAETRLANARLRASFRQEYSDEAPEAGRVISQSIAPGTTVDEGTTVEVVLSKGPVSFPMPDVRSQPVADARAALEAEELAVTIETEPRPRFGPFVTGRVGRVEEQDPRPGDTVRRGEVVTLVTFSEDEDNLEDGGEG